MDIVTLTISNLEEEHICCALSSTSTLEGVGAKKNWLADRIKEGLRFKKLNARGKVFIEYIPAEMAWVPINADGYMFINCFWVSGSYKGQGYGKALLEACEHDARESRCKGVVVTVGKKKLHFLSDTKFLKYSGYEVADSCAPSFELLVKKFDKNATDPKFKASASLGLGEGIKGIDIFYTPQCPFTTIYTKMVEPISHEFDYPIRIHEITTRAEAQNHVCPITTYSLFVDGKYYTNEIYTPDKVRKLIEKIK